MAAIFIVALTAGLLALITPSGYAVGSDLKEPTPMEWVPTTKEDRHFILTPQNIANKRYIKKFILKNTGTSPIAPLKDIEVRLSPHPSSAKHSGWLIAPESTCLTDEVQPKATCSVIVMAILPEMNGGISGYITVHHYGFSQPDMLKLTGYTKGMAGTLPSHVRGHGDACPTEGEKAEIATSSATTGYFKFPVSKLGIKWDGVLLETIKCSKWKKISSETLHCEYDYSRGGNASLGRYSAESIEGPWQKIPESTTLSINGSIECRKGTIHSIDTAYSIVAPL